MIELVVGVLGLLAIIAAWDIAKRIVATREVSEKLTKRVDESIAYYHQLDERMKQIHARLELQKGAAANRMPTTLRGRL